MTPEDYMRQACHTAHDYMLRAVKDIDAIFGNDYAAKHPDLVGQYIRTAAQDYHTGFTSSYVVEQSEWFRETVATAVEAICASLDGAADATRAAARHLGTTDAATPMGALEMVSMELRNGLEKVADALASMTVAPDPDADTPFHVQVWGTDHAGEQINTVRVKHGDDL